jgi:uncharacterized membrane protein YbaN (DUF454 family)
MTEQFTATQAAFRLGFAFACFAIVIIVLSLLAKHGYLLTAQHLFNRYLVIFYRWLP